jgi:hypothetical protein
MADGSTVHVLNLLCAAGARHPGRLGHGVGAGASYIFNASLF